MQKALLERCRIERGLPWEITGILVATRNGLVTRET